MLNLIDEVSLEGVTKDMVGEVARLKSIALTHIEIASMFAVKAQVFSKIHQDNNKEG